MVPGLLDPEGVRWMSGLFVILWALELVFFNKITALQIDGLSSKEHERLVLRMAAIRRRVWWIGGIALTCAILLWVMSSIHLPQSSPFYAAMVGVLFGICLSYLLLIPFWMNESQSFIDTVKKNDSIAKKRAEAAKNLATPD